MKVKIARPPLFDEIDAAFKVAGKPVLFAWGPTIFNPEGMGIPPQLFAHEAVHGERQGDDPAAWWRRYIAEPAFRLAEELPAHRAEFQDICTRERDRNRRAFALHGIAMRLAGPLYGGLIAYQDARKAIAS